MVALPICDSTGAPVEKGYHYKIRLVGGSELCLYAKNFDGELRVTAGPPGCGTLFYIKQDSWTSGTTAQVLAKGSTYGDFKTNSELYTTFKAHSNGNWGLELTTSSGDAKHLYAVAGRYGYVFLGTNSKDGLRVIPHWGPESGWNYINADFTKAYLEVQFVRIPA